VLASLEKSLLMRVEEGSMQDCRRGGLLLDEGWQEHHEAAGGRNIGTRVPTCGMTTQAALVSAQPGLQAHHAPIARLWEVAAATYGGTQSLHVAKGVEQASGAHIHRLGEA
jgi:hypothetical protein